MLFLLLLSIILIVSWLTNCYFKFKWGREISQKVSQMSVLELRARADYLFEEMGKSYSPKKEIEFNMMMRELYKRNHI